MASLYLIRHGEPELTGVMLGQLDSALSAAGREHVRAALAGIEVAVAWTSPLRRATETAEAIRADRLLELEDLREIDQGEWTGKTWAEIEGHWPSLAAQKLSDWLGVFPPGGENWPDFLTRVRRAWALIQAGPRPAAIVGHQGVNAALLHLIEGRDPLKFNQEYGEVLFLDAD